MSKKIHYLDYYEKYKIIPTININSYKKSNLTKQRDAFYLLLGLNRNYFFKKSVLELCAGTGYNAYYLLKNTKIKNITLVDDNSSSIFYLRKNLKNFKKKTKIIKSDI